MPKDIKGNAGRRPPDPSPSHDDIDNWVRHQMPDLQTLLTSLDESIRTTLPDVEFAVKRKRAYYGRANVGWIIELAAYDVSVNVVFLGGADFDFPPPLGSTDRTRYVKVKSLTEARQPDLLRWIEQAGSTPGWK